MLGGRHGHHHPQALRGGAALGAVVLATLLAWPWTSARAERQKIAPDGTVHRIDVEANSSIRSTGGTVLRHTRQRPEGGTEIAYVTGTDDAALDRQPAIEIDLVTGTPVLVWTRSEGTSQDVVMSRYDDGTWLPFVRVTKCMGDRTSPQLRIGRQLTHVLYRQEDGALPSFYRVSFDRATLERVYGPELLPSDGMNYVPPEGEPSPNSAPPPADDLFFSVEAPGGQPGEPGRILVWGVRDEPVPIDYRQGFLLPSSAKNVLRLEGGWIACRFALWFATAERFYYTSRVENRWHEDRIVELSYGTSTSDARLQLEDMIRRTDSCSGP